MPKYGLSSTTQDRYWAHKFGDHIGDVNEMIISLEKFLVDCEPLGDELDNTVYMNGFDYALQLVHEELQRLKKLL